MTTTIAGEQHSSEISPFACNSQVSKDRGEHTIQHNHTCEVESAPCIEHVCIRVMIYIYPGRRDWEGMKIKDSIDDVTKQIQGLKFPISIVAVQNATHLIRCTLRFSNLLICHHNIDQFASTVIKTLTLCAMSHC